MPVTEKLDTQARRTFFLVLLIAFLWLNASEVFRYFAFVMPMTRDAMSGARDVAPMNLTVFMIWGLWDTLLFAVVCIIAWLFHSVLPAVALPRVKYATGS